MGDCKYCGQPAGLFQSRHEKCEQLHQEKMDKLDFCRHNIIQVITQFIQGDSEFQILEQKIQEFESSNGVPITERPNLLIKGCENAVDQIIENGLLSEQNGDRLIQFKAYFSLTQEELDSNGAMTKALKAAVLNNILNGVVQSIKTDSALPINIQKTETLIWVFRSVKYLEDKTKRQFIGGSQGLSVRVMKGIYYRASAFKGRSVEWTERIHVDSGLLFVTSKHLYFYGPTKSFRIPYTKIVSFEPFSDGIGIMRDASNAKPQIFVTDDGWYSYNLITNIAKL